MKEKTVTFYEIGPNCPSMLPTDLTEYELELFDVINNVGAVDLRVIEARSCEGLAVLSRSLTKLQKVGCIERRTVLVKA